MLLSYLRRHIKIVLLTALFVLLFALVFSLYDLPVEAVFYAAALCFCGGILLFFIGYVQYVARHRRLQALLKGITVSLDGLPAPRSATERDYQEMLRALWDDRARALSAADEAREQEQAYYAMWTHQIKVPISALRLLLQEDEARDSEALAELLKIEQYAGMALQYQRLEEGSDLLLRQTDLDAVIRGVLRRYARLFILKKLSVEFKETHMTVLTDEKWLDFALGQLLSNALKYTPEGTIRIYAGNDMLVIADPGIGIRPEDLPRVGERGFTGYNGREDKKSTGIGLYLCKRALTMLGHGLRIESEQGAGTRAYIDLRPHRSMVE
ncbi:MAG: sensor histidine kinase [Clostridiaceae bacterium]|nr:sensor histidine kinase [Clostridiaceae bacterium]